MKIVAERSRVRVVARAPGHDFVCEGVGISGDVELDGDRIVTLDARFSLDQLRAPDRLAQSQLAKHLGFADRPVARATLVAPAALEDSPRVAFSVGAHRLEAALVVRRGTTPDQARCTTTLSFTGLGYPRPKLLFMKVRDELAVEIEIAVEAATDS